MAGAAPVVAGLPWSLPGQARPGPPGPAATCVMTHGQGSLSRVSYELLCSQGYRGNTMAQDSFEL